MSGTWENYIVGDAFMGLLTDAADAKPIPGAAESWTISDDGLTYTFKIRDHKWSDGMPVTAEDFVYSCGACSTRATAAEYASIMYPIKNAEKINSGADQGPERNSASRRSTQDAGDHAGEPDRLFPRAADPLHLLPGAEARHRQVRRRLGQARQLSSATGLITIVEWTPNAQIVAEKNPKFYDAANVKIDKVIYYPDEDRNERHQAIPRRRDRLVDDFASEQIDFLKRELPNETRIKPYLGTYYYPINMKQPAVRQPEGAACPVAGDRRVAHHRQGAEDRRAAGLRRRAAQGPATTASPMSPTGPSCRSPSVRQMAKELLEEAGFGPDNPLQGRAVLQHQREPQADRRRGAGDVEAIGVQAELVNREVKVHYDELKQNNFDIARAAWVADYNDPQNFLYLLETRPARTTTASTAIPSSTS